MNQKRPTHLWKGLNLTDEDLKASSSESTNDNEVSKEKSDAVTNTLKRMHFGLAKGKPTAFIRFRCRNQRAFYIPCSGITMIDHQKDEGCIEISTYQKLITIKGQRLDTLAEYFSQLVVDWVVENPNKLDDGKTEVFISEIGVEPLE